MNKMVQIRNLPEKTHRKLKARAASEGLTITDYVTRLIARDLEKPTIREWLKMMERRPKVHLDPPPEVLIREDRDSR
jgi:plasmid stability protein